MRFVFIQSGFGFDESPPWASRERESLEELRVAIDNGVQSLALG